MLVINDVHVIGLVRTQVAPRSLEFLEVNASAVELIVSSF